jgi:hypothetical protein
MLRRVALVTTGVSEERSASIIRVTRIDEVGTTLAANVPAALFVFSFGAGYCYIIVRQKEPFE